MPDNLLLVVDASVIAKWYLTDEESSAAAVALRSAFSEGHVSIAVPDLMSYEVANAIHIARQRGRLGTHDVQHAVADLISWDFVYSGADELLVEGMDAARRFGCALYDAAYVALAEQLGCDLVTADQRLVHKLQPSAPWVKWLGDYMTQWTPPLRLQS
jgi:predicted nucleic acid-binding protein